MTVEMKAIHFELLEAILPAIPKHGNFTVTNYINKLDIIDASTKFLNESVHYDSTISQFLMTEGFAKNDARQDYVPPIIGQDYPHSSGTLFLTDEGRKLKSAGSYSTYQNEEAKVAKLEKKRQRWNDKKLWFDAYGGKYIVIATFIIGIATFLGITFSGTKPQNSQKADSTQVVGTTPK